MVNFFQILLFKLIKGQERMSNELFDNQKIRYSKKVDDNNFSNNLRNFKKSKDSVKIRVGRRIIKKCSSRRNKKEFRKLQ